MNIETNRATISHAMLRELRCIAATGEPTDLLDWHKLNALAFHARDHVIGALIRRKLLIDTANGFLLTDAGRSAIA